MAYIDFPFPAGIETKDQKVQFLRDEIYKFEQEKVNKTDHPIYLTNSNKEMEDRKTPDKVIAYLTSVLETIEAPDEE